MSFENIIAFSAASHVLFAIKGMRTVTGIVKLRMVSNNGGNISFSQETHQPCYIDHPHIRAMQMYNGWIQFLNHMDCSRSRE